MSTLAQRRERAQRLATTLVAVAIGLVGVTLVAFSVALALSGGAGLVLLAALVFLAGAFLCALGFFFQLVPFKLRELEEGKREHDRARERP